MRPPSRVPPPPRPALRIVSTLAAAALLLPFASVAVAGDRDEESPEEEAWGWDLSADDEKKEEAEEAIRAPRQGPEYAGEVVEPSAEAPETIVVIGGADAVAERFAVDLERIVGARLARTAKLAPHDPSPVLLAGEGGDPELRLLRARAHAGEGLRHYQNIELDEAIESFQDAIHRYGQALPAGFDPSEMAHAFLMLGATHFVAGNRQRAQEAFRQALVLDPGHEPDRGLFSPPLMEAFEGARWEVTAMPAGPLNVSATPSHAEIWINGVFRGVAPITVEGLPLGEVYVMARHRGFVPRVEAHQTTPGQPSRLDLSLRSGPGTGIYHSYRDSAVADVNTSGQRMPENVGRLAEMFSVERVIVGRVRSDRGGRQARLRAYDVEAGAQVAETSLDLLDTDVAHLADLVDAFLVEAAGPAPVLVPEEAVRAAREPFALPAPANDWRFWAGSAAGVAAIVGGVALVSALSGGEAPPPDPVSSWPVIRVPQ